mmetsp:Transcript_48227/g.127370  ORF Transcript_48227/g.127370 Transcript_48227/m.127370 type:complete len:207 (+) Transcript_48227:1321-1941(+)
MHHLKHRPSVNVGRKDVFNQGLQLLLRGPVRICHAAVGDIGLDAHNVQSVTNPQRVHVHVAMEDLSALSPVLHHPSEALARADRDPHSMSVLGAHRAPLVEEPQVPADGLCSAVAGEIKERIAAPDQRAVRVLRPRQSDAEMALSNRGHCERLVESGHIASLVVLRRLPQRLRMQAPPCRRGRGPLRVHHVGHVGRFLTNCTRPAP